MIVIAEALQQALAQHQAGQLAEAEALYRQVLAVEPRQCDALHLLGVVALQAGHAGAAVDLILQAIAVQGAIPHYHGNLGEALRAAARPAEAVGAYRRALALDPGNAGIHANLGMLLLLLGDYAEGTLELEWLWRRPDVPPRPFHQPFWDGLPFPGKTLLIHTEQGLGDVVHLIRYAPLLRKLGGPVLLECERSLVPLMQSVKGLDAVIAAGEPLPPFDLQTRLLGLMHRFATGLDTIPAAIPYLRTDPARVTAWRRRLEREPPGRRIGLVWAGSPKHAFDTDRSCPLEKLAPLLDVPGLRWLSLQKGERVADLARLGWQKRIVDLDSAIFDFADLAAAISVLDLVITVDTAVAHVAGALGRPCWIMLPFIPDWRWQLDRADSPWYPSVRLFRQRVRGDWNGLIGDIVRALDGGRPWLGTMPKARVPIVEPAVLWAAAVEDHRAGRLAPAITGYRRFLAQVPEHAHALHLLGLAYYQGGLSESATGPMLRALALAPDVPDYHGNLGSVFDQLGQPDRSEICFRNALILDPAHCDFLYNRAGLDRRRGDLAATIQSYRRVVACRPDYVKGWNNLGTVFEQARMVEQAAAAFRCALSLDPALAPAWNNLGNLVRYSDVALAKASCARALTIDPHFVDARSNLGSALLVENRLDEADAHFRQVLNQKPDHGLAAYQHGIVALLKGDLAAGWPGYQSRWAVPGMIPGSRAQPAWRGQDPTGQTVLLHAEQGLGDSLQFVRYVPLVAARGARVVLESPAELATLLRHIPGLSAVVAIGQPLPPVDWQCSLMELPWILNTTIETIPANIPYLQPPPTYRQRWRGRLEGLPGRRIGLVWAGNPAHQNDANRSIPVAALAPLAGLNGISFVALQKGPAATALRPDGLIALDLGPELTDFADTAAILEQLDLLIAADTSVVHLAGALGRPSWVLLPFAPDWRWMLDRDDSPWYPSLRLFRQSTRGDWVTVIAAVCRALTS
ncbi:MAG: tetratricopeptide repeat protein [Acidobacteriaceae bacterium]|nr:tetratricopeptide repeat protein [Acidobacteriaceae bacterium]